MLAAFLQGQLEHMEEITARRGAIYDGYMRRLAPLEREGLVRLPTLPQNCTPNYHMFYLLAADIEERTALIAHLKAAGILSVFHYVPLHSAPFAQELGLPDVDLPVTDSTSSRLLRLPLYHGLADHEVAEVADCVLGFYAARRAA